MITTTIVCEKTSRPYRREEADEIIRWFKDNSLFADFTFRKSEAVWRYHGYPFQLSKTLDAAPNIELQYQESLKSFEVLTNTTKVHFDNLAWTRVCDVSDVDWFHEIVPEKESVSYHFRKDYGWGLRKGESGSWIDCEKPEIEKLYQKHIKRF